MFIQQSAMRGIKLILIVSVLWLGVLGTGPAMAQPQGAMPSPSSRRCRTI